MKKQKQPIFNWQPYSDACDFKPCPFCGSHDELKARWVNGGGHVYCGKCGAKGPQYSTVTEAVNVWNSWGSNLAASNVEVAYADDPK